MNISIKNILSCIIFFLSGNVYSQTAFGGTEITKWQFGKTGAISLTYDDATINQFRKALPIMDTLGLKATFFINTADIPAEIGSCNRTNINRYFPTGIPDFTEVGIERAITCSLW